MVKNYDDMLSRFHLIPERYGQTGGQSCYINIARQCADAMIKTANINVKQVYRRRYESRRSSKPKLH